MRRSDLDKLAEVIQRSGIATKQQRLAIIQRLYDWFDNNVKTQAEKRTDGQR